MRLLVLSTMVVLGCHHSSAKVMKGQDGSADGQGSVDGAGFTLDASMAEGCRAVAVRAGNRFGCALKQDATLWCWGDNVDGRLGDGTNLDRPAPVLSAQGEKIDRFALGGGHVCVRKLDGSLWCWGGNSDGQLGDGSHTDQANPVLVTALGNSAEEIAAGVHQTCVKTTGGAVWCWGRNGDGQLGLGDTSDRLQPTAVTALGDSVAHIVVGESNACAVKADQSLWCWGRNGFGQIGDGSKERRQSPALVPSLDRNVEEVVLGGRDLGDSGGAFTCARTTDGSVWCWGDNSEGQLGNGTLTSSSVPVPVSGLGDGVAQISAGLTHACAVKTDGSLWCWGTNFRGKLGDGTLTDRPTPVQVTALGTSVLQASVGPHQTCARSADDLITCWGYNADGQLGDGTTTHRNQPVPVLVCP